MDWSGEEKQFIRGLKNPAGVQTFLDSMPYNTLPEYHCPRHVLQERAAHCYDGALFAAAALRLLGRPPLICNLFAVRDDDHIIALFKEQGLWGCVAKSNMSGLRFREPIHRSLRELVMTYFDDYFSVEGIKSLRSYTRPMNLHQFDRFNWTFADEGLEIIAHRLDALKRIPLIGQKQIKRLQRVEERSYKAGMLGADPDGLYKP